MRISKRSSGLAHWAFLVVTGWFVIGFGWTRTTAAAERAIRLEAAEPKADLPTRPNIVFLYTDDQAQWAMGAYGNADIKTPNLDRLAKRGALFRNAFTITPVCSPSRA